MYKRQSYESLIASLFAGFALGIDGELDEVILHTLCAILSNETKKFGRVSALNIATGCCKYFVSA